MLFEGYINIDIISNADNINNSAVLITKAA